jgi:hypothetical protein
MGTGALMRESKAWKRPPRTKVVGRAVNIIPKVIRFEVTSQQYVYLGTYG